MRSILTLLGIGTLLAAFSSNPALAQVPCPEGTVLTVDLITVGGSVTITPTGSGESFAAAGTPLTVCLKCNGEPLVGVPAEELQVYTPLLAIEPGTNIADGPTGADGCTTFTGTITGGGCSPTLDVWHVSASGVGTLLGTVPIMIKSPDAALAWPSACAVDASDLAAFVAVFRVFGAYNPCFDFDDSGPPLIEASDLAWFASVFPSACPSK